MSEYLLETCVGTKCVGCGSCMAVCPQDAITVKTRSSLVQPTIDKSKCSRCDLCTENCSAFRNMYLEPTKPDFSRIIGRPLQTYIGFATSNLIRTNGASGGVTTALLTYLLDEEIIDYVVTAYQEKLVAQPLTITESKDLFKAQGSIYFPSFITKAARQIISEKGKCAFVGLPCQISSLRRLEAKSKKLRERIHIYLGLFCSHTNEYWYLRYLSSRYSGVRCYPLTVSSRHGKWPGSTTLETSCGSVTIPHPKFWGPIPLLHLSSPIGCLYCDNHMNIHSDIALGDAWLPRKTAEDDAGTSTVIAHTERGLTIIEDAKKKGHINLKEITLRTLIQSQLGNIVAKYNGVPIRRAIVRRQYRSKILGKYTVNDMLIGLLPLINSYLGQKGELRHTLFKHRISEKTLSLYQTLMQKMLLKATPNTIKKLLRFVVETKDVGNANTDIRLRAQMKKTKR